MWSVGCSSRCESLVLIYQGRQLDRLIKQTPPRRGTQEGPSQVSRDRSNQSLRERLQTVLQLRAESRIWGKFTVDYVRSICKYLQEVATVFLPLPAATEADGDGADDASDGSHARAREGMTNIQPDLQLVVNIYP